MKNNLEEERILYNSANFTIHNKLKAIGENINLRTSFFNALDAQESGYYVLWNCINKPYITIEQKEGGMKLKDKYYLPNCIRDDPSFLLETFFGEVDALKFQNSDYVQHLKEMMEEGSNNDNKKKVYGSISEEIEEILKKSLNNFYKNATNHKQKDLSSTMNDIEFIKPEEKLDPNEKCLENISNKSTTDKLIMISNDEKLGNLLFHHFCGAYCGEHFLIWNCIHNPQLTLKIKIGEKSQNLKIPEEYYEQDCVRNDPAFIFQNFINDKSPLAISVSPNCRRKLNALLENKDNVTLDKKAYSFLLREVEDQLEGHLDGFVKKHYKPRKRKSLPIITPKKEDTNKTNEDVKPESGSSTSRTSPSLSRANSTEKFSANDKKSNNKIKSFFSIFTRKSANIAKDKK